MGAVANFRGKNLVAVLEADGRHHVRLARIGAKVSTTLCSYDTTEDAVREARDVARECGWRFIGVFDEARIREIEKWSDDGRNRYRSPDDVPGPDAA